MDNGLVRRKVVTTYEYVVPYDPNSAVPRPVLPIRLVHGSAAEDRLALLDSGADRCTFPSTAARLLGIDLEQVGPTTVMGVGGAIRSWDYALTIVIGPKVFNACPVVFVDNPACPYVLGRDPIFGQIRVGFREARREVYLAFQP